MKKEDCRSVLQEEFTKRLETGKFAVHHVFPGSRRRICEKYGFLYALTPEAHEMVHRYPNKMLDLYMKQDAQRWFESHIGNRKDFIEEFGRSYL